uniref:Geranyl-diphosphate synthase n=1 Tax=Rhizophora mucronata TaxID=61149 RepID=A0A2P2Q2T1_RHIMU
MSLINKNLGFKTAPKPHRLHPPSTHSMAPALSSINGKQTARVLPRLNPSRPLGSRRAMVVATSNNESYWKSINWDIEANLKQAIPIRQPLSVFEPMHHLTFSAKQTTAPALCIAACELVGGHRDQAMAAASALHLMHAAAFAHEQLPLTDRPRPSRRPNTTSHAFGTNIVLLTGDGIMPFGFELLARPDGPAQDNPERILRVIIEIARATGAQGTVEGRYHELENGKSNGEKSSHAGWIDGVCKKKEGEIHACAAACGAILGGGSEEEIEKLRRFGLYAGLIQGISSMVGREEKSMKEVNEFRHLATEELNDFSQGKVKEFLAALLGPNETNLL